MKKNTEYREIPYNYTSFSDKEIILKYFDAGTWDILNELRNKRVTGRSAKLLFEVMGDIFIIDRNPYIFNDFLEHREKQHHLKKQHNLKFEIISRNATDELVLELIERARKVDQDFFQSFRREQRVRKKIHFAFSQVTAGGNIFFSAFHKVSHVTDATDWRVEYPQVVIYPDAVDEIPGIIKTSQKLNLRIIARGGGTGLTGGAVPVFKNTVVINTEKLRKISDIEIISENGIDIPLVEVEAGVITENAMHHCAEHGYIFATDPTSAWASTIGGNIAENAGGKKCVMWGTAIDNLLSFRIVNCRGEILEVRRKDHPHHKIMPDEEVTFEVFRVRRRESLELVKTITLQGTDIRKKGVGKDITNKALGGVPGIQKEGGDGIIVSAKFVLYRPFDHCRTVCLEFFGKNLINASRAIVDILNSFSGNSQANLTALEHFDEKYEAAINYRNKSDRSELPKAVLLIDIEGNDEQVLIDAGRTLIEMVKPYDAEGFVAETEAMRESFWKDRKNLGAIARHTNAFKLNEDVVIPIESLPLFADFIEMLNIRKDLENYVALINDVDLFYNDKALEDDSFLPQKLKTFLAQLLDIKCTFMRYIANMGQSVECLKDMDPRFEGDTRLVFEYIRDNDVLINLEKKVVESFRQQFHGYDELIDEMTGLFRDRRNRKIIIATHMHAGDGNIHVNIPVHSNDYAMLQEADETAGIVMQKTKDLGGVISGEHGIGLTKLRYIDQHVLDDYAAYKRQSDPDDLFNPGKLRSDFPTSSIYTPSFNLLEKEAFILEASDLGKLNNSIASCVRCGKCKDVCNTHHPGATMFYSPRNKILGVSLITEAVLYEAQTTSRLSFRNFRMLHDIADHCTGCHNCYKPCPVNIDFGEVTLAIKALLVERNRSKFKVMTSFVLFYLRRRGVRMNTFFRILLLKIGYGGQRMAYYFNRPFLSVTSIVLPYISAMLKSPLPRTGERTLREIFDLKGSGNFYAFYDPSQPVKKSVVYFPGCGSERMFPEISMAVIALLNNAGVRVVIAPEYLCCGYPMLFNGRVKQARNKSYENRVIFHRMAETIGYMDIQDVVVSCGTCHEMLSKYGLENIFPDSVLIDVNEFMAREGLYSIDRGDRQLLYHEPCHTPMKKLGVDKTFSLLLKAKPVSAPNCCGEGGTLSLSTPDISNKLRDRKALNISRFYHRHEKATVLTTCPSCVQGLSKIHGKLIVKGQSLVVYLAEEILGRHWKRDFIKKTVKQDCIERIIL